MNKDNIFNSDKIKRSSFCFDKKIANVFDNMVQRSVPFYDEIITMISQLILDKSPANSTVYDLGCATGETLIRIANARLKTKKDLNFIGIDSSQEMLNKAIKKLDGNHNNILFKCDDINKVEYDNAGAVILNYTLQFITPKKRLEILSKIADSLLPGGIFFLSEKISSKDNIIDDYSTKYYFDFKRKNHYSNLEISSKRDALENILIPYTVEENAKLLKDAGFKRSDLIFKWYNFATFIAFK